MGNASTLADVPCQAYTSVAIVPTPLMLRHGEHSKTLAGEAVEGSRRHHLCKARRFGPFDRGTEKKERERRTQRVCACECVRKDPRDIYDFNKKTSKQRHRLGKAKEFFLMRYVE